MARVLVGLIILYLGGPPAVVQADGAPEPFKSLAGAWVRPAWTADGKLSPRSWQTMKSKDGQIDLIPVLTFVDNLASMLRHLSPDARRSIRQRYGLPDHWSLVVGAGPVIGSVSSECYASHHVTPDKKSKGTLILEVDGKKVLLEYKLEKDTLTIDCKELLPAGCYLERTSVSGTWVRAR